MTRPADVQEAMEWAKALTACYSSGTGHSEAGVLARHVETLEAKLKDPTASSVYGFAAGLEEGRREARARIAELEKQVYEADYNAANWEGIIRRCDQGHLHDIPAEERACAWEARAGQVSTWHWREAERQALEKVQAKIAELEKERQKWQSAALEAGRWREVERSRAEQAEAQRKAAVEALEKIKSLPCHCEETRTCHWHIARETLAALSQPGRGEAV